jgi:FKBP-type peptidyl-prolyl cis-trans isomerase 2
MRSFFCLVGVSLTVSGCTHASLTPPATVTAGENITIEYTCKTEDGKLAATSYKTVAEDPAQTFSPLFTPLNNYLPASEKVPTPQQAMPLHPKMCFEEILEKLISRQAAGAPFDAPQNMSIAGELIPGISGGDRYLLLNRTTKKNRLQTLPVKGFEGKFGATPVMGIKYDSPEQPGMSATVENMEGDKVVILHSAEPGTVLPTHFGRQIVTQVGNTLEFKTDATLGAIIRSAGMIGKVSKVDDETIEIDYGHSSGFTPLTCDVVFKPFTSPDGLSWHDNLDSAKEESRQTGKPLLIHFHDQWSSPNRTFLAKVLPDPKVIDALGGYVRTRINSINQLETLKLYGVATVPTIQLYDSQGSLKSTITGLTTVEELVEELQKVQADAK